MTAPAPTPAREYQYLHAPILAFYARSLYRDVAHHWTGLGLGYLLLVVTLITIPQALRVHVELQRTITPALLEQVARMPAMKVRNGALEVAGTPPLVILEEPADRSPVIVVDNTGTLKDLDDTPARMLVLKDRILARQADGTVASTPLEGLEGLEIDAAFVTAVLGAMRSTGAWLFFLVGAFVAFFLHLLQAWVMSGITRLLAGRLEVRLPADVAMRLTIVALTPALLTGAVLGALDIEVPAAFLLWALMTLGYVNLALQSVLFAEPGNDDGP